MITVTAESFRLARTFTISRGSKTEAEVLTVRVTRGGVTGWGECVPYARYGGSLAGDAALIAALPPGITRAEVQEALPPGSALQTHMGASGFPGLAGQTATAPPLPAPMPPSAPPVFAAPPDQSDAATLHRHALHAYDEAAEALAGAQSLAERVVLLPEKGDLSLEASQMPPYRPGREGRLIRG